MKSEFIMNGYYNLNSSNCWDEDGWLHTGDIVYYDSDNCFYHVDRIKEMLKYKSWHVPPALIESVMLEHPAVLNAIVVGIPHPLDGDHPMALVILKKRFQNVTVEDLKNFVNKKVDDRQQLRGGLKILREFPLTPSGKVQRKILRDMAIRKEI